MLSRMSTTTGAPPRTPAPLSRPDFRWFFAGRLVSLLGSSMAPVALAFAILDASGRPGDLGIVLAGRMIPLLAFLLVGGAVADRFPRRTVLLVANVGAGLTQGAVAAILLAGAYHLLPILILEVANGILDAFTMPALRGVVPQLVDPSRLREANSLLGSVRNATKIVGPSLSGLLVVAVGSGPAIAFDAATFLAAAVCLARLPLPPVREPAAPIRPVQPGQASPVGPGPVTAAAPVRRATLLADIGAGWSEFRRLPWVWVSTLSFGLMNLVQTGTWQILGPTLTKQVSGIATWGFVLSARGVGLLVTSAVMYRLVVRRLLRFGQIVCVAGGLPLIVLGLRFGATWLVAAAFVAGLAASVSGISWDTSLQEHVPAAALSRVSSYDDLLSYLVIPVGQLLVGPLAAAFGGFRVCLVAGVAYVLVAAIPLLSRQVRNLPHTPA